tara:strand:- start:1685 stop:1873 length:189 start_codon:yes stop_codon:yes gene_type:complete|eukprot:COSAG01_NODE_250_length_20331_cov_203.745700_13_plen_63_part_00
MEEFFKEYKNKPNKELLDVMKVLKEEFDKTKSILIKLSLHIEDIEKKFNTLNKELDNRKKSS